MIAERKARSVKIPKKKLEALRIAVKQFPTLSAAQFAIGVDRSVLDKLQYKNTCSPVTLAAIETYLQSKKVA